MDGIKHSGRFAEMERLVNDYFNCHIACQKRGLTSYGIRERK